jgi:hypothetical protein
MLSGFEEHFPLEKHAVDEIFENGIVVVDTNVLLNIYRYSPATRSDVTAVLNKMRDRIWFPNQVIVEFLKNRLNVIASQTNRYNEFKTKFLEMNEDFVKELEKINEHPFLDKKIVDDFKAVISRLKSDLETKLAFLHSLSRDDTFFSELVEVIQGKIGAPFTETELKDIYKEGEDRFVRAIPPGFEDKQKKGNEKFGDLVIWKQICIFSKTEKKAILFVTDDKKSDWWLEFRGERLGPRTELREELKKHSGVNFHIQTMMHFLEMVKLSKKADVSEQTIKEVENTTAISSSQAILNAIEKINKDNEAMFRPLMKVQNQYKAMVEEFERSLGMPGSMFRFENVYNPILGQNYYDSIVSTKWNPILNSGAANAPSFGFDEKKLNSDSSISDGSENK